MGLGFFGNKFGRALELGKGESILAELFVFDTEVKPSVRDGGIEPLGRLETSHALFALTGAQLSQRIVDLFADGFGS